MATARRKTLTASVAIAISLAVTVSLSGCFSNPIDEVADKVNDSIAKDGAEKMVEDATGGKVDAELGGELPDDFPKDEVPLIDAPIKTAVGMDVDGGKGWTVAFAVDDPEAAAQEARQKLKDAGFAEELWNANPGLVSSLFKSDRYAVIFGIIGEDEDALATYTVSSNQGSE